MAITPNEDLTEVEFIVKGRAVPQPRYTQTWSAKGRRLAWIRHDHPIHRWKDQVRLAARASEHPSWPLTGPVELCLVFVNPGRGDLDNLVKAVKDALQGIVYHNDSQVECLFCSKRKLELHDPMLQMVVLWEEKP